jgi:thiol-disulfide isomerase/thioredoxin
MFEGWQYYSAVWLLLVLALAVGLALFWRKPRLSEIVGFGVLFVAIIGLYFFLRPAQGILDSEEARIIGQGTPVLLKFQSPYCVVCIALKPTIDAIEDEFADRLIVLRIDAQEEVGRQFAQAYGFQYTPTFVYFDPNGVERWRLIGLFDEPRLRQELAGP